MSVAKSSGGGGGTLAAGDRGSGALPDRAEHHSCAVTPLEERRASDSFLTCSSCSGMVQGVTVTDLVTGA